MQRIVEIMGPVSLAQFLDAAAEYMARNPDVAEVVPFDVVPRVSGGSSAPPAYTAQDPMRLRAVVERSSRSATGSEAVRSRGFGTVYGEALRARAACGDVPEIRMSDMPSDVSSIAESNDDPVFIRPERWHVGVSRSGRQESGYCYLGLIYPRDRDFVKRELGRWPTFRRLLEVPYTCFRRRSDLLEAVMTPMSMLEQEPVVYGTFLDSMLHLVRQPSYIPKVGSIAERYASNRRQICGSFPKLDDEIGGRSKVPRVPRGRYVGGRLVPIEFPYSFPMAQDVAEEVFTDTLSSMGVPSTEYHTEQVLLAMVPHFLDTSARKPWQSMRFECFGTEYSFSVLISALERRVSASNAVRLWVRSFRRGLLCHKMVQYLSDPVNWMVKQYMAYKYRCVDKYAIYAFDCNSVLKHVYVLKREFRNYLRMSKWLRFAGDRKCVS